MAGKPPSPQWLTLAREIYTLSQAGLAYSKNDFDLERYQRLQEISAEIIAGQSALEKEAILESFSIQAGYPTPKVDVRAAVIRDGKILLVQEITDGCWSLPGGWADLGESPQEMVEREVLEESGMTVRAKKVIAVYDANNFAPLEFWHAYKVIFLCKILDGEPTPSMETPAVDFFDPANLPPFSQNRTNQRILNEILAHIADPNRPAAFD
ncbi:MAG: NUDIX hydrolase [Anaerolineales bacterium]|jgi:ADP-ribose pyrophosphatase YjhB (NUDIX family)|nr:NUDIX hydrolase [Anaerolineales bacterium]